MKSPINYSTIDLRIHGIRGLPYEADTNLHYLPFRVILLRDADEICTESSCHNVFVHSLLNSQWHTNSEEDDNRFTIHSDLDPTNDKTHFRLDLHGRNLCMFTFEINLNTIHRDREAVWCNLINCEGYEIDGAEVQLSVCFDDKPESILKNIHQEQIIEAQKSNICEAQESMFNIEIQMQEMTRGTNEVTEESLIWLSFEFLDNITQTDLFSPDDKSTYPSKAETFQFYGTHEKAWLLLHDDVGVLKIYVCGNSGILTCFHLGLAALFCSEEDAAPVIHQGSREIITNLCHTTRSEHEHGEEQKVSSSSIGEDDSKLQLSITLQIHSATSHSIDHFDMTGGKANGNYHRIESPKISTTRSLDQKKIPRFESSANISKTIDAITNATRKSKAEIEEKRKQWERFRQKEEDKFHKHLKKKEEEVRKYLQHQIQKNEDSHSEAMKTCRNEYLKLELRLKKALVGVESKERETKRKMDDAESAHQKKMNELELSSLREGAKLQNALKEAETSKLRAQEAEMALVKIKQRYQESEKGQAEIEIVRLKGCLLEIESELKRERDLKNAITSEQEHYRVAAHKLATMVRNERTKRKETPIQNQCADDEKEVIVHDCERKDNTSTRTRSVNDLHRIKAELTTLMKS